MIIPVGVAYEAERQPVVTFTFIGLNIAIFVLQIVAAISGTSPILTFGLIPAEPRLWSWITSIFLHGGILHLAGNMVYLYLFGACIEDILGRGKFVAFYLGGGFIANLIQVFCTTRVSEQIPIIGASGAISACIGAFLVVLPKTEINFWYFLWFKTGDFWLRSWIVISFWFFLDFLGLIMDSGNPDGTGGVAFGAHVGGTIAGVLIMLALRKKNAPEEATAVIGSHIARPTAAQAAIRIVAPPAPTLAPIYLFVDGNQIGPYPPDDIRAMMEVGSISSTGYFWRNDTQEWKPLSEF